MFSLENLNQEIDLFKAVWKKSIELVQEVEAMFPQQGQGAAKLLMVRTLLQTGLAKVGIATEALNEMWPMLQVLIGAAVTLFNGAGLFRKA